MSIELYEKIREIRETEGLGRTAFEKKTGISRRTIETLENQGKEPRGNVLKTICKTWPEYTLWLMTDTTNAAAGQVSPDMKLQVTKH